MYNTIFLVKLVHYRGNETPHLLPSFGTVRINWTTNGHCDKRLSFPNKYARVVSRIGGVSLKRRRCPKVEAAEARHSDESCHISSVTLDPEDKADLCLLVRQTEIGWVRVEGYHRACLIFLCSMSFSSFERQREER